MSERAAAHDGEVLPALTTDDDWASYIAESDPRRTMLEYAMRVRAYFLYCQEEHGKQGGSHFAVFMTERFGWDAPTATRWNKVGQHIELLAHDQKFSPDLRAIYDFTRLDSKKRQLLLDSDKLIDRKAVRAAKALRADPAPLDGVITIPEILCGDFRVLGANIPDGSISLIFTDPPYAREHLDLYSELSSLAARVLTPGGSLLCFAGQSMLPEVVARLGTHLRYWWINSVRHSGGSQQFPGKFVFIGWKPLLWYVKDKRRDKTTIRDCIDSTRPEKEHHEWAQSVTESDYYIEHLTTLGELVLDPMCGAGTVYLSARRLQRQFLGYEIDSARWAAAQKRCANAEA